MKLTKLTCLIIALVIVFAPVTVLAQLNMQLADNYLLYSAPWSGSLVNGMTLSIAVPENYNAIRSTYPIGVEIVSSQPVSVIVSINSVNHPTGTTQVVPTPLNTRIPAEFFHYTGSNAGMGQIITEKPPSNVHLIMLDGVKFATGKQLSRNINVHISAVNSVGYVTWKIAQK